MRVKRKTNKTNLTRPSKGGAAKRRRQAEHRKRLIALGVDETEVARMNPRKVRTMLKYPAKLAQGNQ